MEGQKYNAFLLGFNIKYTFMSFLKKYVLKTLNNIKVSLSITILSSLLSWCPFY